MCVRIFEHREKVIQEFEGKKKLAQDQEQTEPSRCINGKLLHRCVIAAIFLSLLLSKWGIMVKSWKIWEENAVIWMQKSPQLWILKIIQCLKKSPNLSNSYLGLSKLHPMGYIQGLAKVLLHPPNCKCIPWGVWGWVGEIQFFQRTASFSTWSLHRNVQAIEQLLRVFCVVIRLKNKLCHSRIVSGGWVGEGFFQTLCLSPEQAGQVRNVQTYAFNLGKHSVLLRVDILVFVRSNIWRGTWSPLVVHFSNYLTSI